MTKQRVKSFLKEQGVNIYIKDIEKIELIKRENIGHVKGWTADTYAVKMTYYKTYYIKEAPTGIYSGRIVWELVKEVK